MTNQPAPAWTADQLADLETAYANGVLETVQDGKRITYRSRADMLLIINQMRTAIYGSSGAPKAWDRIGFNMRR